jgi:hypothetical protein
VGSPAGEGGVGRVKRERKMFFFEKKNQKTFTHGVRFRRVCDSMVKSFLLLFFKKEDLSFSEAPRI